MNKYSKRFNKKDIILTVKRDKTPDPRNWKYVTTASFVDYPKSTNNKGFFSDVKYQGVLGSCQSFALISIFEYYLNRKKLQNDNWDLSEMFNYYYLRAFRNKQDLNVGGYIIDAVKTPFRDGFTTESYWPYDIPKFTTQPSFLANVSARIISLTFKLKEYRQLSTDLTQIKDALYNGNPILFGIPVTDDFIAKYDGAVLKEMTGNSAGYHAMVIVDYDDDKQALLVRNSWSKGWGNNGYCWLSYELIPQMFDLYVILPQ